MQCKMRCKLHCKIQYAMQNAMQNAMNEAFTFSGTSQSAKEALSASTAERCDSWLQRVGKVLDTSAMYGAIRTTASRWYSTANCSHALFRRPARSSNGLSESQC